MIVDDGTGSGILDFTNEPPVFIEAGGLPYSTDISAPGGERNVGWNVVPEPLSALLAALALLGARAGRRSR
ncbi:MAG: hypothetical protein NTV22_12465 [bacterium]|nr:hypothetical protein [bacterium]